MRSKKLNEAFQYVDDKFLNIVELEKRRKRPVRFYGTIVAACICLMFIISVGVMAKDWFGIRSLLLPSILEESQQSEEKNNEQNEEQSNDVPENLEVNTNPVQTDVIGLSGYTESTEMQALAEWQAFLNSYDQDGAIINEIGNNPTNLDSKYNQYAVYTQEMCDKLEEIVGKYNLKLHSELNVVSPEELSYRVGKEFIGTGLTQYWGYIYEDGAFQFDGDVELNGEMIGYQLRRVVKGTFDEVVLNIGDVEKYLEYQYVTASGEPVLLALGPNKALIFAEFEECFITLNVLSGSENGITEDHLKMIADEIDFTVLKDVIVPDMRGDSMP